MQKAKFWLPPGRLFSPMGRMSRLQYLVHGLLAALGFLGLVAASFLFSAVPNVATLVRGGLYLAYLYFAFCQYAKRLHDIGAPAAVALAVIAVPLLFEIVMISTHMFAYPAAVMRGLDGASSAFRGLPALVGLAMLFVPGNKGPNRYGADPSMPVSQTEVF